ncbi:MAG: hypothetical protein ACK56F_01950, partial [bacterium]
GGTRNHHPPRLVNWRKGTTFPTRQFRNWRIPLWRPCRPVTPFWQRRWRKSLRLLPRAIRKSGPVRWEPLQ